MFLSFIVLRAQTSRQVTCFGSPSNIQEFDDFTEMGKWKLLFVNGCECYSPISDAIRFLNP